MKQNFYEVISMAVTEELERLGNKYTLQNTEQLEKLCSAVTKHIGSSDDYQAVNVTIDGDTIILSVLCDEIIVEHRGDLTFLNVIVHVDGFSFSKHSEDTLQINLFKKGCLVPYGQ